MIRDHSTPYSMNCGLGIDFYQAKKENEVINRQLNASYIGLPAPPRTILRPRSQWYDHQDMKPTTGNGIAYRHIDHIGRQIRNHLLPPAWGGTPVPWNLTNPPIEQWDKAAIVNLALNVRRAK